MLDAETIKTLAVAVADELVQRGLVSKPLETVVPLSDWESHRSWPSVGAMRQLVFFAHSNGLEPAIIRVGRKVLINLTEFDRWVASNPKTRRS